MTRVGYTRSPIVAGLPAVIGTAGATTIESGTPVEVDPTTGTIRVVDATKP